MNFMHSKHFKLMAIAAMLAAGAAQATPTPQTGNTSDPSNWRFTPGMAFNGVVGALDGVAKLSFTTPEGNYACSGSLLAGGQYVITAAHCADDFSKMKVEFGYANGSAAVTRNVAVGNAVVHKAWNGSLDTGADIAILKLDSVVTGIKGYKLSTTNDVGKDYLMAGYGTTNRADVNSPTNWNDGAWGHYGYNTFDVVSQEFNAAYYPAAGWGPDDPSYYAPGATYMSDFDNGTAALNTIGRIAEVTGGAWTSGTGLGTIESMIAGGDSGGGDFVWNGSEWLLSGVHSWGWGGDSACGDVGLSGCDNAPRNGSSFGDLSGSTAIYSHVNWINTVTAVPEPETYAMLLAGLAMVGVARRRRLTSQS